MYPVSPDGVIPGPDAIRGCPLRLLCLLVGIAVASQSLHARASTDSVGATANRAIADSIAVSASPAPFSSGTAERETLATGFTPGKSPGLALLFSAIVPGAGQFYNESYWKVPIVLGFGVWLGSQWIDNHNQMKDWRTQYAASITAENPGGNSRYLQLREFYKNQRDTYSWYLFIWYMLTLVDAYVDASLYDFSVGDDLSVRFLPVSTGGLRMQVNF